MLALEKLYIIFCSPSSKQIWSPYVLKLSWYHSLTRVSVIIVGNSTARSEDGELCRFGFWCKLGQTRKEVVKLVKGEDLERMQSSGTELFNNSVKDIQGASDDQLEQI